VKRVLLLCALAGNALARPPEPRELATFSADDLRRLAPLLRNQDLALIESNPNGKLKQLTTMTLAAAPPQSVYDVVAHAEKYSEFVRNMKESRILSRDGTSFVHQYECGYVVYTVDGRHRYKFPPPDGDTLVIDMADPDENGVRHYRWELHPVGPNKDATLVVLYGYTLVPEYGLMKTYLRYASNLEHGLGLIPQLTLILSIKHQAEKSRPQRSVLPTPTGPNHFRFLLDRGILALFRTNQERLSEVSLVARSSASKERLMQVLKDAASWSNFIQTITFSRANPSIGGVDLEQSLPLLSYKTKFAMRIEPSAVDMFAVDGDLRGGRWRFDVSTVDGKSELTLRAVEDLARSSLIVRQLYKIEPYFDYGINVGLEMMIFRGLLKRAEQ
jgi:hypothetical protein